MAVVKNEGGEHDPFDYRGRRHCEVGGRQGRIGLSKVGWVVWRDHRPLLGKVSNVTIHCCGKQGDLTFDAAREEAQGKPRPHRRYVGIGGGVFAHTPPFHGDQGRGPRAFRAKCRS